ncbi:MAG TPA: TIM-barrel domain-containing protein, partial [Fimbriimonadaceae bacterium]|nr:TIM-barrel domain-containing protein [Fimbriimonadaceae bacterium]
MRLTLVALLACVTAFAAAAQQKFHPVVVGNVRIEILSPTLVRIEQKGPEGFEDRPTFNVVGRTGWPEAPWRQNVMAVDWANWELGIPNGGDSLDGLKIYDKKGNVVYTFDGKLTNSEWLPEPGHVPRAWAFADTPRMVPSKFGLTPDLDDPSDLNSGWDLGNDAPDVYVFLPNGSYKQLRSDFLKLTGRIEMPPLYALGFTDSRYYEYHQDEALQRMDEYRRRQFPLDTFVVDTDWRVGGSHGYQVNTDDFPDMPAFLQDAHKKHVHIMFNDHPEPQSKTALDPKELQYRLNGLGGLLKEGVDIWWYDRN